MTTNRVYRDGTLLREDVDLAELPELLAKERTLCWVDERDPDPDTMARLQSIFGLHPLAVEDTTNWGQRPKVEVYGDHFFVVLHAVHSVGPEDVVEADTEIHAFASPTFLVTVRSNDRFTMPRVTRRWDEHPELLAEGGGFLLYGLLDEVVDDYLDVIEEHEDLVDRVQDAVFEEGAARGSDSETQEQIFRLRRGLLRFRRKVVPLRQVLDLLQELPGFVSERLFPYYRDVADHVVRTLDYVDSVRELLIAALEAQLAQASNRLSVDTKKISAWGAIVLVPTLIAGIYGMNFKNLPELDWKWGYPMSLGAMALSAAILYAVFKRREWL